MRVAILGGGVIGAATAYYLSRRGLNPVIIERTGLANAASGKSGGFLARDWCDGTPLQMLARRSFDLHARLADEIAGDWGYRRMTTYAGTGGRARGSTFALDWLSDAVSVSQRLGSTETTAQVHPRLFTEALMRAAEASGAQLRVGEATGIALDGSPRRVTGVMVDGERIAADVVVVAMGPWSIAAAKWLPLPPVFGLKGHSLVFETGGVPADAVFLDYPDEADGVHPEVFPRLDGTTYICGLSSGSPLPADPAAVVPDPGAIERLESICRDLSPVLAAAPVRARQACYRPVARDGLPLIGAVSGVDGAYVATGHSVWGILNAPATGEAMAELIADGAAAAVDLSPFDPGRLGAVEYRQS